MNLDMTQRHSIYFFLIAFLLFVTLPGSLLGKDFVLVIDAGHGGKDPGALGTYSKEKNINLNVALKVGELIKKNCSNVKIVFTRQTDKFVSLDDRADIANKAKADLFISIHTNAMPNGVMSTGSETYSLGMARAKENLDVAKRENSVILYESDYKERYAGFNPNSSESYIIFDYMQDQHMKQSAELAKAIQKQYQNSGRSNKGVHQAGFLVLRKTSMPSVLTELGFISTPQEEQFLNSANELSKDIYAGFMEYCNVQNRHKSVILTYADEKQEQEENDNNRTADTTAVKEEPQKTETVQKQSKEEKEDDKESQPAQKETKKKAEESAAEDNSDKTPVYKIQICTSSRSLRDGCSQFKGVEHVSCYMDNNIYKYTCGSTTSYSEIQTLKKTLMEKFPDCFVVAFQGKEKISLQEARKYSKK